MSAEPTAERTPVRCRCGQCGHTWIAAYTPMPVSAFARLLKRAACPSCGEAKQVYLYEPGRTPAQAEHDAAPDPQPDA